MESVDAQLSQEETGYVQRLARRYSKLRKSSMIDADDLISAANLRWWQFCLRQTEGLDEGFRRACFYQQVKGAMRDVVRDSSPVKVTRTMQAQLKAYERPSAVPLDYAVDVQVGDESLDSEVWMDVIAGLKRLGEREQIILSLYFEHGFNFSEIAQVLEVSVSTVTRTYHKAIESLKRDLGVPLSSAKKFSV